LREAAVIATKRRQGIRKTASPFDTSIKEGTMKRRSRSLIRSICYAIVFVLFVAIGLVPGAGAETIAELETKAADCRKALAWATGLYDTNRCAWALSTSAQDDPRVRVKTQDRTQTAGEISALESRIDSLNQKVLSLEMSCDAAVRAGELFPPACTERDKARTERKTILDLYREKLEVQKNQDQDYRWAVDDANKLREDCKSLKKQIADGENNCRAIEQRLQAARRPPSPPPQPQRTSAHPGTPNTFHVECNPMQVPVDGIVTCTVHGIFVRGSSYTNNIDLTNDPETVWQNGPRVSAKGLKPGQTFVVRATKGGASDGVTITVVGAKQGTTGRMIKVGFVNYQKIPGFTVTLNGTTKSCSGGSGGASWSNVPATSQSQGAPDCVFEVPAGSCEVTAQASGYQTQTFRQTYDKDQTSMITMIKSR
jgi:hypothetical protein